MRNWYILRGKTVAGPFDLDDLERMVGTGELQAEDPATCDEFRFWYRARDVTGLDFPVEDSTAEGPPPSGPEPLPISVPVPLPPAAQPPAYEGTPAVIESNSGDESSPAESPRQPPESSDNENQTDTAPVPDFTEVDGLEMQYSDPVDGSTEIAYRPQLVIDWKSLAAWGGLILAAVAIAAFVIWRMHGSN